MLLNLSILLAILLSSSISLSKPISICQNTTPGLLSSDSRNCLVKQTNGERFRRGLPPLVPKALSQGRSYSPNKTQVKRAGASSVPKVVNRGNILVTTSTGTTSYVVQNLNGPFITAVTQSTASVFTIPSKCPVGAFQITTPDLRAFSGSPSDQISNAIPSAAGIVEAAYLNARRNTVGLIGASQDSVAVTIASAQSEAVADISQANFNRSVNVLAEAREFFTDPPNAPNLAKASSLSTAYQALTTTTATAAQVQAYKACVAAMAQKLLAISNYNAELNMNGGDAVALKAAAATLAAAVAATSIVNNGDPVCAGSSAPIAIAYTPAQTRALAVIANSVSMSAVEPLMAAKGLSAEANIALSKAQADAAVGSGFTTFEAGPPSTDWTLDCTTDVLSASFTTPNGTFIPTTDFFAIGTIIQLTGSLVAYNYSNPGTPETAVTFTFVPLPVV